MSAKVTSLFVLAAITLAACDNNSNSSDTPTVVAPTQAEVAVAARANAIAPFNTQQALDDAATARQANADLEAAMANTAAVNELFAELITMSEAYGGAQVPELERPKFNAKAEEINALLANEQIALISDRTTSVYLAELRPLIAENGAVANELAMNEAMAAENVTSTQAALANSVSDTQEARGETITLADGTVLQTASAAVYTRNSDTNMPGDALPPTASVIVAYETDIDGNPTQIAFYEAGGIAFEGAPVGTAFVTGNGTSYAFMEVANLGDIPMAGDSQLMLDFNNSSGTFGANMTGANAAGGANVMISADLTFNRQTGQFTTSTGSIVAFYGTGENSIDFTTTNDLMLDGNLRGLAEAYSGTFQVNGAAIKGDGAFIGTAGPVSPMPQ